MNITHMGGVLLGVTYEMILTLNILGHSSGIDDEVLSCREMSVSQSFYQLCAPSSSREQAYVL